MNTLSITKTLNLLSDTSVAFLTILALSLMFASGCALLNAPKNIVGGLHRTPRAVATTQEQASAPSAPSEQQEVSSSAMKELAEMRDLLRKMVADGEMSENEAKMKFLQEKSRIMAQEQQRKDFAAAQEQQRELAARQRLQQALGGLQNCYTNGLGYTSCF